MAEKGYYFDYLRCYNVGEPQFREALQNATDDTLQRALRHYELYPYGNKTRKERVAAQLRKRERAKNKA